MTNSKPASVIGPHPAGLSARDISIFIDGINVGRTVARYRKTDVVYSQGDVADSVLYIKKGKLQQTVLSPSGKQGTIAILEKDALLGEGCLAGQAQRMETARALMETTVVRVEKAAMLSSLQRDPELLIRVLSYALSRSILLEENLIDQLFNSSEKRLARRLLGLAQIDAQSEVSESLIPPVSQQMLAEMIGTTRERVNFFLKQFKQQGFIRSDKGIYVRRSLLSVLLRD